MALAPLGGPWENCFEKTLFCIVSQNHLLFYHAHWQLSMLFDKKCSAPLLPQPLPERGACGVGTLAVEKVDPAPVALVAVQGAQAVVVQRRKRRAVRRVVSADRPPTPGGWL